MPKVITDQQTRAICRMINQWDNQGKLDWANICSEAQGILGWEKPPTRQALNKKETIKIAYSAKKEAIRRELERAESLPRPKTIRDAAERIARLEKQLEDERFLNSKLVEFNRMIVHNASINGLKKDVLLKPLLSSKEPAKKQ